MIKVGRCDILEQLGRIPIAGATMWIILTLEMNRTGEFFSMMCILIWMILPSVRMFKIVKTSLNNEKENK